jgi:alkylation response protein AidB-like acyl-CoA dehydrogenase
MEITVTAEDRAFREEVRTWLEQNVPREPLPDLDAGQREYLAAWQRKQYDAGWAGIAWPKEYGGRGLSPVQQMIWYEEYARAGGPDSGVLFVGLNHGGPTLILRADEEQKAFHLPRILRGESIWCQGFSEPGSGSDLASLRTSGVIDGDHIVVNGQKIWTSYAQVADYQELLVRTDTKMSKHRGITWIINDMTLPGVTVRPIETLTGESHFAEVFYDNVRIPLKNVVGGIDNGWSVAMSTLSFERGTAFMQAQLEAAERVAKLVELSSAWRGDDGRPVGDDEVIAARLATLQAEVMAMRALTCMSVSRGLRQDSPGPEGTYLALYYGELTQRITHLAMEMMGPRGLERDGETAEWTFRYLRHFSSTIGGGTSEIRRNIIGERVLNLPR